MIGKRRLMVFWNARHCEENVFDYPVGTIRKDRDDGTLRRVVDVRVKHYKDHGGTNEYTLVLDKLTPEERAEYERELARRQEEVQP